MHDHTTLLLPPPQSMVSLARQWRHVLHFGWQATGAVPVQLLFPPAKQSFDINMDSQ